MVFPLGVEAWELSVRPENAVSVLDPPLSFWFLWFDCLSFVTRPNFQMLSLKQNIKLPFKFHLACRVGVGIDYILCFVFVLEQKPLLDNDHSSFKVGWIARLQHCRCILNACIIISLIMNMLLKSWYLKIISLERIWTYPFSAFLKNYFWWCGYNV